MSVQITEELDGMSGGVGWGETGREGGLGGDKTFI